MTSRLRSCVLLLAALALVSGGLEGPASAVASPTSAQLAAARSAASRAKAELDADRAQLTAALLRYDSANTALGAAQVELQQTGAQIVAFTNEIASAQDRLNDRAVRIYEDGGSQVVLQVLLGSRSFADFLSRSYYLLDTQQSDADLLGQITNAREQSAELQAQEADEVSQRQALIKEADARRATLEADIAKQRALVASLGTQVAQLVKQQEQQQAATRAASSSSGGLANPPVGFDPNTLISDAAFTDSGALTAGGVQTFLAGQSGALKSYSGVDHAGKTKTAAQMITEASSAWGVSPKVILATLQKEQSLLSDPSPSTYALDWAMGCGKTDSVTYTQYRGFGNQIWSGARVRSNGRSFWHRGMSIAIDGAAVYPTDASTESLYRYTPHFGGATLFWKLYWRYFGDPRR